MDRIEQQIDDAIAAEERELLRQIGEEPGYFTQLGTIFTGSTGWVNGLMVVSQTLLFFASVYAGWRFFAAVEPVEALHWGLPAVALLLMSLIIKLSLWPTIQANRVLLAVKRLELLLAARL